MTQSTRTARARRVADVAAELDVSTATVYRLIQAGDLDAFKVGRTVRIPQESVDRLRKVPAVS